MNVKLMKKVCKFRVLLRLVTIFVLQDEEWMSTQEDTTLCTQIGQSDRDCKNFVKVFQKETDTDDPSKNQVFVCGTHAFQPKCRVYKVT